MNPGTLRINMRQMGKWQTNSDNIHYFDRIHKTGGAFFTLDASNYIALLCDFGIFYTFTRD